MEKVETVSFNLIKKIRTHINRTEKLASLLANREKWTRLTSALDVLEDTSSAIEYYMESEYPNDNIKGKYLYTYGLLQALFVQQDAISSISVVLTESEIDFKSIYPCIYAVRELRNDVVDHPTYRNKNFSVYLSQCSLSKYSFHYFKNNSTTGHSEIIDVNVKEAIHNQAICINTILEDAIADLDVEFKQYIEQHRDRKMKKIFDMLHYAKEKTLSNDHFQYWALDSIKDMVQKCEKELSLRYGTVEAIASYKHLLDEIHEIFDLIDNGISNVPVEWKSKFRKHILHSLFAKLDELVGYCEETDAYFENYGNEPGQDGESDTIEIVFHDQSDE